MVFRLFTKAPLPPPPLTTFCMKLSAPEYLLTVADGMTTDTSSVMDNRAMLLSLSIMAAAGHFVGESLRWEKQKSVWQGSDQYLRNTNLDVITAEAIVWVTFLMGRFWIADRKRDQEMFLRIGYGTVTKAGQIALAAIERRTGFDFNARATDSRKLYLRSIKDAENSLSDAFASVVLRTVGCRSLSEPLKTIKTFPPSEWTPITLLVSIFFSTVPLGFYDTFKNMLRMWPDRFSDDDEGFDDEEFDDETDERVDAVVRTGEQQTKFILSLKDGLARSTSQLSPELLESFASSLLVPLEYEKLKEIRCQKCGDRALEEKRRDSLDSDSNLDWPYLCPGGDRFHCRCKNCGHSMEITFWFTR